MFDYVGRRARLSDEMRTEGVEALFLAPSADLEYLTGVERQIPNFGEASDAFSLRIEDIVVCEKGGGRVLNTYPAALVANR
jgi:hypothetical protein